MSLFRTDNNPGLTTYFSRIRAYPPLSRDKEADLAESAKTGCEDARNKLIQSNLGFVVKIASEYRNLGVPFEDLLNEGNLGLIEASRRFDTKKGTKFITYAIWWIRKSILKALSERSALVRVPSYQLKKVREIRETENRLSCKLGRQPDREEVSAKLDRSLSKVDQALQYATRAVSLDQKVGKDQDQPIAEFLADEATPSAEADLIKREDFSLVSEAMRELTDQERQVVCHRFGISGGGAMTLKEVGKIMSISRERVRQIECQAKLRMRKVFDSRRSIQSPPKAPGLETTARNGRANDRRRPSTA